MILVKVDGPEVVSVYQFFADFAVTHETILSCVRTLKINVSCVKTKKKVNASSIKLGFTGPEPQPAQQL